MPEQRPVQQVRLPRQRRPQLRQVVDDDLAAAGLDRHAAGDADGEAPADDTQP